MFFNDIKSILYLIMLVVIKGTVKTGPVNPDNYPTVSENIPLPALVDNLGTVEILPGSVFMLGIVIIFRRSPGSSTRDNHNCTYQP